VPSREILALGCSAPLEPSAGRRHFLLRGTDFAESCSHGHLVSPGKQCHLVRQRQRLRQVVVPLLAPIMPLCYRYFSENRPDASPGPFWQLSSFSTYNPLPKKPREFLQIRLGDCRGCFTVADLSIASPFLPTKQTRCQFTSGECGQISTLTPPDLHIEALS
jgi:hypothetical protein